MKQISDEMYERLCELGIINAECRDNNEGASNYAQHIIQPWSIWMDWQLNPWDADIIKRTLRTKSTDDRVLDYKKIKHICDERIRQLTVNQ